MSAEGWKELHFNTSTEWRSSAGTLILKTMDAIGMTILKPKPMGEFDCVLKRNGEKYDFYECKYYDRPMSLDECTMEKEQIKK